MFHAVPGDLKRENGEEKADGLEICPRGTLSEGQESIGQTPI
jgi:hypothetical protein